MRLKVLQQNHEREEQGCCGGETRDELIETLGTTHGALDVQRANILPVLLQQRDEEVDSHEDVGDELILAHLDMANSNSQAKNLEQSNSTGTDIKHHTTQRTFTNIHMPVEYHQLLPCDDERENKAFNALSTRNKLCHIHATECKLLVRTSLFS